MLPEPRVNRTTDPDHENLLPSPVPRPSPAMSQLSDASFLSQGELATDTFLLSFYIWLKNSQTYTPVTIDNI